MPMRCPECDAALNAVTMISPEIDDTPPEPEDITVCFVCLSFLKFDADPCSGQGQALRLVPLSAAEFATLPEEQRTLMHRARALAGPLTRGGPR